MIVTDELTKRYPGVMALDQLSIHVEAGVVGLVGANGAGKSTLIKILLGLLTPSGGSATVLGLDVASRGAEIRQRVGYMPEHDCLPPDTSATDLVTHLARISGLPTTAARERTADILRHVGLYEERYRPIGGYSTGMRQRVKLAQALVHDPRLVFLDEPTNGLDPAGREEMLRLIRRIGSEFGISVLLSSHLLGEIERACDSVVIIDAGRLLRASSVGELTERGQVLLVEVLEGQESLGRRLAQRGLVVRQDGRLLLLNVSGEGVLDLIRDTVAELGLSLVRMEPAQGHIEDLFREPEEGRGRASVTAG